MKVAVTSENGMVFQHFGHCKEFTVFEVEDEKIVSKGMLDAGGNGHSALAHFLMEQGVEVLICGGIGVGARAELTKNRIELVPGTKGPVDEVMIQYLSGEAVGDPDYVCTLHSESEEGHDCGGRCGH